MLSVIDTISSGMTHDEILKIINDFLLTFGLDTDGDSFYLLEDGHPVRYIINENAIRYNKAPDNDDYTIMNWDSAISFVEKLKEGVKVVDINYHSREVKAVGGTVVTPMIRIKEYKATV